MLISTKEMKTYLQNLKPKIKNKIDLSDYTRDDTPIDFILNLILEDLAKWEAKQLLDSGSPPYAFGVDSEQALIVYCGGKLYEYVESFDGKKDDFTLLDMGKLWLQVKPFLKEGRFKRV